MSKTSVVDVKHILPFCYNLKPVNLKLMKLVYPTGREDIQIYYVYQQPLAIMVKSNLYVDELAWTRRRKQRSKQVAAIVKDVTKYRSAINLVLNSKQDMIQNFVDALIEYKLIFANTNNAKVIANERRISL